MDVLGISNTISGVIDTVADKFFVDASEKEKFKLKAIELQQAGEFKKIESQLSVILAEAKSKDRWTSRARPGFLYVIYVMILAGIPVGVLSVFDSNAANQIANGMQAWLAAIPETLWQVFGVGYLGYTGARSFWDKRSVSPNK